MEHDYPTILSAADYARLQGLMCTMIGARTPLASLVRRKLGSAVVTPARNIASTTATGGRRVRFRIDGGETEERVLTWSPLKREDGRSLSLLAPRGLALLGLCAEEAIAYQTASGRTEFIEIDTVVDDAAAVVPLAAPVQAEAALAGVR